jgi:DNA adenine methylase/adenine-specific DNA-methyltransferase
MPALVHKSYQKISDVETDSRFLVPRPVAAPKQVKLFNHGFPTQVEKFPQIRFMGSKYRLLPWIYSVLSGLPFESAADAFSGSGCVGYLFKAMGKRVATNDFLNLGKTLAMALVENPGRQLVPSNLTLLLELDQAHNHFIERTFSGIFFTPEDLRFLDQVSGNIDKLADPYEQAIALSALIRSCVKRQPRGVFTIAGDPEHYKDGRRDLKLNLREHFLEQVEVYNVAAFDNQQRNTSHHGDVFDWQLSGNSEHVDLVYMDPPYVPRSDDNCYMKRYHFLEGLSCYWRGKTIMSETRVKKIVKPYTPFSYRKTAIDAFDNMFRRFADSILVLSYSSNGYPDLSELRRLMGKYKRSVEVFERDHRYHFGTHSSVKRALVKEYLIIGV